MCELTGLSNGYIQRWAGAPQIAPLRRRRNLETNGAGANSQNSDSSQKSAPLSEPLWFSDYIWVAGLLFPKLGIFWVFRAFNE